MISIVIPTFNRAAFLRAAVASIVDQTFRDWELIVVDDGSQDDSQQTVESFQDRRIRYFLQDRQGVSAARNAGLHLAERSWICFLDSDDRWLPQKLERQLEAAEDSPGYPVLYTDEIWIRRGRRVNPRKIHRKYSGWIYHRCLPRCIISPSSVMLRRELFDRHGHFDPSLPVCEDYDLWLRLTSHHPVRFVHEQLIVKLGGHPDQLSRSTWGMDRYRLQSLLAIYSSGALTPLQRWWTALEIKRKAQILQAGYSNRGKKREAREFEAIAAQYGAQDPVSRGA